MKVIFLDIDGVLNSVEWLNRYPEVRLRDQVDPEAVAVLNNIIDKTGAKVVISSSWRIFHSLNFIKQVLENSGFRGEIVGKTPGGGGVRGPQIQEWLDNNPVESFVILDDSADMEHLLPKLVRTDCQYGLQEKHVEEALSHLL